MVDTFSTGKYSDEVISAAVNKVFDLRPAAIIKELNLTNVGYKELSAYGHMGREELDISWEKTNKIDALLDAIENN